MTALRAHAIDGCAVLHTPDALQALSSVYIRRDPLSDREVHRILATGRRVAAQAMA